MLMPCSTFFLLWLLLEKYLGFFLQHKKIKNVDGSSSFFSAAIICLLVALVAVLAAPSATRPRPQIIILIFILWRARQQKMNFLGDMQAAGVYMVPCSSQYPNIYSFYFLPQNRTHATFLSKMCQFIFSSCNNTLTKYDNNLFIQFSTHGFVSVIIPCFYDINHLQND